MSAVIHLSDPDTGLSYCGEPVTLIEAEDDTRPICQTCHRGAMKTMRSGWWRPMAEQEYTPTTDEIRYRVEHDWEPYGDGSFDRWLDQVKAEARAEGERAAAERIAEDRRKTFGDRPRSSYTSHELAIDAALSRAERIARGEAS